ncbi:polysaccharide pyruvyl transferase family protein [Bradyrhizobium sp. JYMT SZCCT0428]|uniref:polysaccharide pyruvyl transferase family protein n=1 Tax=Bradyrhizobium sp. JYMT SZCCT0428 TaxID=2807673 RepID=UPI001BAAA922|nr:polysaccharide pyruvyl transferase family protein [Bradyrhizobium sp. JYMT SZCCT0428]MBR1151589.1 polysaccharide pyruvyl transferase family protein [Bradyrhizobium sp. JYMT SZCCT0428]
METIAIVDTSICGDNLGDEIIMDAVNGIVTGLFPDAYIYRVPSHESLSDRTRAFLKRSTWCFVGGTNILSSNMHRYGLWRLSKSDAEIYGQIRTTLLGAGWIDYTKPPSERTKQFLKAAFRPELLHSVRDTYTKNNLADSGIRALMTSCPTMWALTPDHCAKIPRTRARDAVITLSAWREAAASDRAYVDVLKRHYKKLYFFCQSQEDYQYFSSFGWTDIKLVPPTIKGYNQFLDDNDVDFIGTRLHGGIRALQRKRRALILSIDNRATEIAKDTGLPVVSRDDTKGIEQWIEAGTATEINLPEQAISAWKAQFRPEQRQSIPYAAPRHSFWDEGRPAKIRKNVRTASGLLLDKLT